MGEGNRHTKNRRRGPEHHLWKHGGKNGFPREYEIWLQMRYRCYKPQNKDYHRYGGRGITVCDRWRFDFGAFLADMGARPTRKHSIDRIDNDGNYEPSNCRWATPQQQADNTPKKGRFLTLAEETLNQTEWARKLGISRSALRRRLELWPVEKALTTPNCHE